MKYISNLELVAVDGLSASTISAGEVTTLAHEVGDYTMEGTALEMKRLATLASAHLTSAESTEIL